MPQKWFNLRNSISLISARGDPQESGSCGQLRIVGNKVIYPERELWSTQDSRK